MNRQVMSRLAVGVVMLAVVGGCGGDDGGTDATQTSASAASVRASDELASGELALGDPCELVPPAEVNAIVAAEVAAELVNVGDGLPGATCSYTVAGGGVLSLSITPDGAGFYEAYRDQAGDDGIEQLEGVGDEAFIFQDTEVVARHATTMIQLQVFTGATTAGTGGVEIMRLALAAIGG